MSITLGVRLKETISIERLRTETENALKEILNVPEIPPIHVSELIPGVDKVDRPVSLDVLDPKYFQSFEDLFFAFIYENKDEYHRVNLMFQKLSNTQEPESEEDYDIWASLSLTISRSHFEVTLMAAIAIALARLGHTTIEDDAWMTPLAEPTVEELLSAIVNPIQYSDTYEAADAVHKRLVEAQESRRI
ncbi:MAG: hypothetical protein KY468_17705 [Armatimonadetes bacterium]|nr:hypothetical protein [Armatimonadota bacterium]